MRLRREWIDALLHGEDPGSSSTDRDLDDDNGYRMRFTQDSPILPDVWKAFGQIGSRSEGKIDLLLTPFWGYRPGDIYRILVNRIGEVRVADAKLAYNQTTAVLKVNFDQLISDILPLTGWWMRHIERLVPTDASNYDALINRLEDPQSVNLNTPSQDEKALFWLAECIGALLRGLDSDVERTQALRAWRRICQSRQESYVRVAEWLRNLPRKVPPPLSGQREGAASVGPIFSVTRNRPASISIDQSTRTVKADAVSRLFDVSCRDITWAIVDTGIDATHPAFRMLKDDGQGHPAPFETINRADGTSYVVNHTRIVATFDFTRIRDLLSGQASFPTATSTLSPPEFADLVADIKSALMSGREIDWGKLRPLVEIRSENYQPPYKEHGTHVGGVLGAGGGTDTNSPRGVCPDIQLYDLRVLSGTPEDNEFAVISALQFIRFLNAHQDRAVIHGVNLSLSLKHDVRNYACGRTPICEECERLVGAGVTVVAAAGNRGWREDTASNGRLDGYQSSSITDPGNAERVITVGSTHRCEPHTYGISYFSSRGPTGDGRSKPDIVAPGEKIEGPVPGDRWAVLDGTSMAAPHVSGAAALLMARNNELIGRPVRIKQILCSTATDLGREKFFQGAGLLDILRALQSV